MASCPTEDKYGYDDCRFERRVDENFHCSVCYNVLKEPRMCRNNEHIFCHGCITQHLKVNNQTCPECGEYLSVDTLRRPRVVTNYLSKLRINCDYASRGCPDFTCLEELKTHVASCGYAPVLCSNVKCGVQVNRRDKDYHETTECEHRESPKCHDCGEIQEAVGRLEGRFVELDGKLEVTRAEMKNANDEMTHEQQEVKKEMRDLKSNICKMNKDVDDVKVMMSQVLRKLSFLELLSKVPSPTQGMLNRRREDILIVGGDEIFSSTGSSTEIYSWEEDCWFEILPMDEKIEGASSFIYDDQLFVVGGNDEGNVMTMDLKQFPLKWTIFSGKHPFDCANHKTVVCDSHVIFIGGYINRYAELYNMISEFQVSPSCPLNDLCRLPYPRQCHAAEVFENKVLILGGQGYYSADPLSSVRKFDPIENLCGKMKSLPYPLTQMATVRWRDQVVVLGGRDEEDHVLNDVFMYDCKTGNTKALPSMLEKRIGCCAVITGDTIVVMGGENENDKTLNSVECFTMGASTWEYLPAMNLARYRAVAEVLPNKIT